MSPQDSRHKAPAYGGVLGGGEVGLQHVLGLSTQASSGLAARSPFTDHTYLCGALQTSVVLLEWVEPMQKFMLIKVSEWVSKCPRLLLQAPFRGMNWRSGAAGGAGR